MEKAISPTAAEVLAAIESRGATLYDNDVRHAVHEAHHALEAKVPVGKWETWTLDRYVKRMGRANAAASEIRARAVEQIVCARLGIPIQPLEHWVSTSCLEAIKFGDAFMDYDTALRAARSYMETKNAQGDADVILALVGQPVGIVSTRRRRSG